MDLIKKAFLAFKNERFDRYKIGKSYYEDGAMPGDQFCQNPFIKIEADIQVKFGGFLEEWLLENSINLTVHAEMPVYNHSHSRADMTLHQVTREDWWVNKSQMMESLHSVIEIKYANVKTPYYDFESGGIDKDLTMLQSLSKEIERYILLVDEAEQIDQNHPQVQKLITTANSVGIKIISNNEILMDANS